MTTIPFAKIAAVIRFASLTTANRLTDLGQKNEIQFMGSLKELLAFLCTIACNEVCAQTGSDRKEDVVECYSSLCAAFWGDQPNSDLEALRVPEAIKITVAAMVNGPEANFQSYFWSYWNGDLHSLRISPADMEEIAKRGIETPTNGETGAAAYAVLVRVCRYENPRNELPPTIVFLTYDKIVREEVGNFLQVLKAILRQKFFDEPKTDVPSKLQLPTQPAVYQQGLNRLHERDFKAALELFRQAAKTGDAKAQYAAGFILYEHTMRNVLTLIRQQKNDSEAFNLFRDAAEQGHLDAQYMVGIFYQYAYCTRYDGAEARRWFHRAASKGHSLAEERLRKLGILHGLRSIPLAKWVMEPPPAAPAP